MPAAELDRYRDGLDEPKGSTLSRLRRDILAVIPDAEQCLSYAVPGFKVAGRTVAGFAAFKNHLSYLAAERLGVPRTRRRAGWLRHDDFLDDPRRSEGTCPATCPAIALKIV